MPFIFPVDIAILGRRSAAHGLYLANFITQLPAEQLLGFKVYLACPAFRPVSLHIFGESEAVAVDLQIGSDVGPIASWRDEPSSA